MTTPVPKLVSPSRIARYYYFECDRFLRYSSTPREELEAEGVPPAPFDSRPITRALLEGGFVWEEHVVGELIPDRVHVARADQDVPLRDRVHNAADSIRLLAELRPGEHVYQPTLQTPPRFYQRYGLDPDIVRLTDSRPDLMGCTETEDGQLELRVIDVKASPQLKLSHRIQSTMYSLILEHALAEAGIDDRRVSGTGGVWLSGTERPERFDIRAMRPPLEAFLEHELQPLMRRPASDADWHVYFRCEWCDYFDHCREEMRRTDDVSRVPYLSGHAKSYLRSLDPPVRTVEDPHRLAGDPARIPLLNDAASLRGRADRIRVQTDAMRPGKVKAIGGSSIAMPKGEHVRIVLTVQDEPVSGSVYAYGIHVQGMNDLLGGKPKPFVEVAPRPDPQAIDELEQQLLDTLHRLLSTVDAHNREHEEDWSAQKPLQVYVFDSYEQKLLTDVLLRRILDPAVAEEALKVFLHFQQPELIQAEDHPRNEVFFPVVVLVQVLRNLLALPVEVTYRFRDAVELLPPSRYAFEYRPNDFLSFELSNQIRSDAILGVWHQGNPWLDRIERELRQRVWATNSLINGMRETLESQGVQLFAWPPKFRLPDTFDFRHTVLSRLAFLARYESVLGYLSVRTRRMATVEEQLRSGDVLRLRYRGEDRFELDPMNRDLDIDEGSFKSWILTEDSEEGFRAKLTYNDYANRGRVWVPKNVPLALAAVREIESSVEHPNQAVHLDLQRSTTMPDLRTGATYLLGPRFTDFNTDRVIADLHEIDAEDDPPFVRLIERPHDLLRPLTVPATIRDAALRLARRHGMTESQLRAFEGILRRNLQLVWGPPGTGKTHFLALAILCLAEANRAAGQTFRVLLTAFTHAAIDNCLRKLAQLNAEHGIVRGELPVVKLKEAKLADMEGVEVWADKDWEWPEADRCVVGGTVWGIRKGASPIGADLLVIDEASQLKVPEAAIAVRRVRPNGRLLIAGDDRQLPPIVQGGYPEPHEGEPILHRSIFECLRAQDPDERFTSTLLENFRMNLTLCRYPALQIYVPDYRSATVEIARRRLTLTDGEGDGLGSLLVDPDYPLVVGILDGVRATAENRIEAALVAEAALELRRRLCDGDGDGGPYPSSREGEAAFWKRGLFVVSPHHAQINAVSGRSPSDGPGRRGPSSTPWTRCRDRNARP